MFSLFSSKAPIPEKEELRHSAYTCMGCGAEVNRHNMFAHPPHPSSYLSATFHVCPAYGFTTLTKGNDDYAPYGTWVFAISSDVPPTEVKVSHDQ